MRYILFTFIILFSLSGCQSKEEKQKEQALRDAKIVQETRAKLLAEFEIKEIALKKAAKENEAKIAQQVKEALLAEQKAKEKPLQEKQNILESNTSKLSNMGVQIGDGVITVDTNKTKNYFKLITEKMSKKIKEMSTDLEKGIIKAKNAGIEMSEDHINIDLNKTKDLLEDWNQKIKVFIEEFDTLAKDIEHNSTTKGN